MAVTSHANGTTGQTSGGAESTISTITSAGIYQLWLDMDLAADGDQFVIRAKYKVRSAGTTRVWQEWYVDHDQDPPVWCSPPIAVINELVLAIEQPAGTTRALPYEIIKL